MASTIIFGKGHGNASVTVGTDNLDADVEVGNFVSGPPSEGQAEHRGIYVRQLATGDGTFRWLRDEPTPGTAAPTDYQYMQNPGGY